MEQCTNHMFMASQLVDTDIDWIKKCSICNKTTEQMFKDLDDYDPLTKPSQQPHGKQTMYCNKCQGYVKPTDWDGNQVCPYHQRMRHTEDGDELMYEEFDQYGE